MARKSTAKTNATGRATKTGQATKKGRGGRPKKTDEAKPQAKADGESPAPKKAKTSINPDDKALFLRHLPKIVAGRKAVADATNALRTLYKQAKIDGFLKADFDTAIDLQKQEGEAAERAKIARKLTIARFMAADIGEQLDLFLEPSRVPAADRAYAEGQSDCMQAKTASPSYSPETEQYRSYMKGYHDETERRLKSGMKPLSDTAPDADGKETPGLITKEQKERAEAERAEKMKPSEVKSGVPMTRSQLAAANRAEAQHEQKRSTVETAKENAEKAFKKREPQPETAH